LKEKSYMFGDNESVVTSSTLPHSTLSKRHNALAYHRVREAIAAGIIAFHYKKGKDNPADILSKHWAYNDIKHLLQPILYWMGNAMDYGKDVQVNKLNLRTSTRNMGGVLGNIVYGIFPSACFSESTRDFIHCKNKIMSNKCFNGSACSRKQASTL